MGDDPGKVFDVEETKVMEFSLLFSGQPGENRDFDAERLLLREGRDLYECGRLRRFTESWDGDHRIIAADVMNEANERVRAHVTIRMAADSITGMACTCTRRGVPRCVHACAVCFRLFYRHRYTARDDYTGRMKTPGEASGLVSRYMADRLGTWFPRNEDDMSVMAKGLEVITGFDQWERWVANSHTVTLLGNCMPTVEESIDNDTRIWPKRDEPDLSAVLPHGWFTMLEAAYEGLDDFEGLAKVYGVYIAQGHLPQDSRYVDRLRWLLGDSTELTDMIGKLTKGFRPVRNAYQKPVPNLAYEHLLREFQLSDEAVAYCESLRKSDLRCTRRLSDTIAIGNADRVKALKTVRIDWSTCFSDATIDSMVMDFRAGLKDRMPAFFANGYVDPIVEDCEELIHAAGAGVKARCRLIVSKRFSSDRRATIARDLLREALEDGVRMNDSDSVILERAVSTVEPCADRLARTFLVDDDVVVFTAPVNEETLRRERPLDFMDTLGLVDTIDGQPLVHDEAFGGAKDLAIIEQTLSKRIERRKTEARFDDIVTASDDDYDAAQADGLEDLRKCLNVQLDALFGSRYSLDVTACDDLFDPPVTVGQRNKWLRPTAGQLGVWSAMYVLNVKRHAHGEPDESVHLPYYLAAKGLRTAMIGMLDHMLGVSAMLGLPRSQVDLDEWNALHLLRIDPHPESVDAHGHSAILRPDREFTVPYLTDTLRHTHHGLELIDVSDKHRICNAAGELRMRLDMLTDRGKRWDGWDDDTEKEIGDEADNIALALALAAYVNPECVLPLIEDPVVARAAAEQTKQIYMTFRHARDENDATPVDDDDEIAGHESDITDAANMMLILLEQAYTNLMNIAEPGYKDW